MFFIAVNSSVVMCNLSFFQIEEPVRHLFLKKNLVEYLFSLSSIAFLLLRGKERKKKKRYKSKMKTCRARAEWCSSKQ